MRAISLRAIVAALAVLVLPAVPTAGSAQSAAVATSPHPLMVSSADFDALDPPSGDPECEPGLRQRAVRSRNPGPLSWLFRFDRTNEVGRHERPFAFYLRSPLLSGLYSCPPRASAGARPPEPMDECAELTITTDALEEHKIQVLLPQLEARNAKRLRSHIDEQLKRGEPVTVIMTGGEPFSIVPGGTRDVEARACRRGVWNEP